MGTTQNVNEVAAAIHKSISIFVRKLRLVAIEGELTPPEYSALSRLDRNGPTTTTAMARVEQITTQSMGATLTSLVDRGFVARRLDPDDGRKSILVLTSAGRKALRSKRDARTLQLAKALSAGFTDAEMNQLMIAAPLIERLVYLI
jgi:DNA-binding MarR family transcriptional regulator